MGKEKEQALMVAEQTFTIEEFLANELKAGRLKSEDFPRKKLNILVHGHCHQKALSSMTPTMKVLKAAENFKVQMIPSGCCGMAGSFGMTASRYDLSQSIGELALFPAVRALRREDRLVMPGTSCRHQVHDACGVRPQHPIELIAECV